MQEVKRHTDTVIGVKYNLHIHVVNPTELHRHYIFINHKVIPFAITYLFSKMFKTYHSVVI